MNNFVILDKLSKMRYDGYHILCKPYKPPSDYKPKLYELDGKYWLHVQISYNKPEQLNDIIEIEKNLLEIGVRFDTGLGNGYRDWWINNSFKHKL